MKVKIASRQGNVKIKSMKPSFVYTFSEPDLPIEVNEEHAEKILRNKNFYISEEKSVKEFDDFDDLLKIKGIGKETLVDLKRTYNTLEDLKNALKDDKVSLRNDIVEKLRKYFNIDVSKIEPIGRT
jgi:predicted membrane protein